MKNLVLLYNETYTIIEKGTVHLKTFLTQKFKVNVFLFVYLFFESILLFKNFFFLRYTNRYPESYSDYSGSGLAVVNQGGYPPNIFFLYQSHESNSRVWLKNLTSHLIRLKKLMVESSDEKGEVQNFKNSDTQFQEYFFLSAFSQFATSFFFLFYFLLLLSLKCIFSNFT